MSLREIAIDAVVLGLAVSIAAGWGYTHGFTKATTQSNAKVLAAESNTRAAQAQADQAKSVLDNVQRRLASQVQAAETAKKVAAQALADRDITNKKLALAVSQRQDAERKAAHESPECADLERLPLCPAVAQRLFQAAGQTHAAPAVSH